MTNMQNRNYLKPKPAGVSTSVRNDHLCMQIMVHNIITKQF